MPTFLPELFVPAAQRVSVALAGALGLVLLAERHHLKELRTCTLFLKWRTWAFTAPLYGAAAMGPRPLAVVFVSALSLQGLREYAALTDLPRSYRRVLYAAGVASAPIAALSLTVWRGLPPLLLLAATIPPLLRQDAGRGARDLAYAGLGFAYVPWLLTYFVLIREHVDGGSGVLLALGTATAASDVAAFALGTLAGRHHLAPGLSPNKTWEGALGNLIGAYLGFALMSFALPDLAPAVHWTLPALVATACLWGDLVESMLKRGSGAKDAGDWLPGFGGLLDRIDSFLVVLPIAYTTLVLAA